MLLDGFHSPCCHACSSFCKGIARFIKVIAVCTPLRDLCCALQQLAVHSFANPIATIALVDHAT